MRTASKVGSDRGRASLGITGVTGDLLGSTLTRVRLHLRLPGATDAFPVDAYSLHRIEVVTPSSKLDSRTSRVFQDLPLADPHFDTPGRVELVLGADIYPRLIRPGVLKRGRLLAQQTVFGWTITGQEKHRPHTPTGTCCSTLIAAPREVCHETLIRLLQRFWAIEEIPRAVRHSPDDLACEDIFRTEHFRDAAGRYSVPLPICPGGRELLGESLSNAKRVLRSTQHRMAQDPTFRDEYVKFMDEYLRLGHMRRLTTEEINNPPAYTNYLPHHGLWQRTDGGRKLRVVFNASCPTASGYSLNDVLYQGPKLQTRLPSVFIRWRRWAVAFCADIKMMFRMIRINATYVHLQRIVWSPSPDEPVIHCILETVTYGESPAPYLAIRTLKQLCLDEGLPFPEAVRIIEDELYVDDFLSGADSEEEAIRRRNQLIHLLRLGGFSLKKWISNHPSLLADIPADDCLRPDWKRIASGDPVTELGIRWDPATDCLRFAPPPRPGSDRLTKRQVLAEIARLFDPAGLLSPVLVVAKLFIQDLWRSKIDWDTTLPADAARTWTTYRVNLHDVSAISLPRWFGCSASTPLQLHAFADASSRAIAAVVYLRVGDGTGTAIVTLAVARTKLTPLRGLPQAGQPRARMTIPRLELRAALMAAQLLKVMAADLSVSEPNCYAWSDSTTVLHWLQAEGSLGNSLVDNYVSHVHETMPHCKWRYVNTAENPADVATRGTTPAQLKEHPLWWSGPPWLSRSAVYWPPPLVNAPPIETSSNTSCLVVRRLETRASDSRFSSLTRLIRVMARCRRLFRHRSDPQSPRPTDPLTAPELEHEFLECVRRCQQQDYPHELEDLRHGRLVRTTALKTLSPFLDDSGIMRVGGRLDRSELPYDIQHPVIIDGRSYLAKLIIAWAHLKALHGGFRTTYSYAMQRAWIVRGRVRVRDYLRSCVVCAKASQRPSNQVMASLPAPRVTPSAAFERCGVDYAGPFNVLCSRGRGIRVSKGYVAVFVCLSTKAIHLELVGDLTTASFLGALSRFSGRRGLPTEIWSDNATTFKGADIELRRMLRQAEMDWGLIADTLASDGIQWRFIPPSAPHFGGLWEAGVKSMKNHLRRVCGPRRLTFEEFATVLVSVEAVLNSRPLGPVSGDLDDLHVLTPAHFMIGRHLRFQPQPGETNDPDHVTHWRLAQALRDHFWIRWSQEYLNTLQQRFKWTQPRANLAVGQMVIIIDPSLLRGQGRWPLGIITQTFPGSDGRVRVVRVKTSTADYTRPVSKIVRLPVEGDDPAPGASLISAGDSQIPV